MGLFKIISQQVEYLINEFLRELNLTENKIYALLNYKKYNILFDTKEINNQNYIDVFFWNKFTWFYGIWRTTIIFMTINNIKIIIKY